MRQRSLLAPLVTLGALLAASPAQAEEGRFDAQTFRPSAAPRDLVMVQKSEVIGHLSPTIGLFTDFSFDPLVLVDKDTNQRIDAVAARLQLTGMAGIGFFNWFDVSLAMPFVAWQSGGNLRSIGTEGSVQPSAAGDLRVTTKLALPFLNRKDEIKKGFGMAVAGNVNLPTGSVRAFAGDGVVTGGASIIADYRFNIGLILAANGGVWFRPDRQLAGIRIGNMASFGVSAEAYVVQRWGLSVIGEVYGYPSLTSFPDKPKDLPAEVLLGIRWMSKHGITITVGGSFGAACGFGTPALRLFNSITWQPKTSREQEEINRLLQRDTDDPDHDGMIGEADHCPEVAGRPENFGCPDQDTDQDGVMDRDDDCPDLAAGPRGKKGCPTAYIKGDEIAISDQVHFALDKDIILDDSKSILEDVAELLIQHPELREVKIEGHTDVRATDAYNMNLSQRRVNSVMKYLVEERGIDASRLQATGFGHTTPLYDDTGCQGPDEGLSQTCLFMTSKNRRVVFRIMRRGAPPPRPLTGGDGNATSLPTKDSVLPTKAPLLPNQSNLPGKQDSVLGTKKVLPGQEEHALPGQTVLPGQKGVLPGGGKVLPNSGTPKKPDPKKPVPDPKKPPVDPKKTPPATPPKAAN
jgi:outer membrane protein OmpA-like peptidoglycan-associated protein